MLQRNARGVVSGLDNSRKTSNARGGASWIFTSSPNCGDSPTGTSIVLSGRRKKLRRRRCRCVVAVVVLETLGETQARLRNANCAEDAAGMPRRETPSPSQRFYNEPKATGGWSRLVGRIHRWQIRRGERRLRGGYLPTYLEYCRHTSA